MNREKAIDNVLASLDTRFIKVLTEPVRIEILKQLTVLGESDVKTLADRLPQDRSVISRHLGLMEQAGMLRAQKEGRHVIYRIDGESTLHKAEQIVEAIRACLKLGCC